MAERNVKSASRDVVAVTGSSGYIGSALVRRLAETYAVVGFDLKPPDTLPPWASFIPIDLSSEQGVQKALAELRRRHGLRIASVIHLAAYFDLSGEPDPKYEQITLRGTERLLRGLEEFQLEQFVFGSSMLAHKAGRPGEIIDETWPLEGRLPYRVSKIETERLVHALRDGIAVVYLRPAGVYDDRCGNPFLAQQIARIYERDPKGHVYPGDLRAGQSFIHIDDLIEAILRIVLRRKELPPELPLLVGEEEAIGYGELQGEIGWLMRGEYWETWEVPKPLAKAGAWVEDAVLDEHPFIRPWMVDIADDHYALDTGLARKFLDWQPQHSLRGTLPRMIDALRQDPVGWYRANRLNAAKVSGRGPKARQRSIIQGPADRKKMRHHMGMMHEMHYATLWTQFLIMTLGAWLLTSPWQLSLFDPDAAAPLRAIAAERELWSPVMRNTLTGWSDIAGGLLLILFGGLALLPRHRWAQWGTVFVGLWLLFAPLIFWTPSAAAYMNDTIVGALAIALSVLIPMMPGMSHEGMMDEAAIPAGWSYSPSSWLQRLPIIALGLFGFFIARTMAAYQMGHIDGVWEPFFQGGAADVKNGTEYIITSEVSKAWPIPDAGLGAASYMLEALMGAMGAATRWRTMPWMVTFFFILVVPLGGVSIFFIVIQPIVIGTYCTLCLIAAFAMLVMIPLTLDEVVAMGQYMAHSRRAGRPFWRTFFEGGPDPAGRPDDRNPGFAAPFGRQCAAAVWGVTLPWQLLAASALGIWLMASRLVFGTEGLLANSDHLVGAMILTIAVCAMAEVARPLRFINIAFGLWLLAAPWLLGGAPDGVFGPASWNNFAVGLLVIALSLPRGARSKEHYGSWDRFVV